MAHENEIENETGKTQMSLRLDNAVIAAVSKVAEIENRPSFTNTVVHLLKTHPSIQPILEGQTAEVAA